MPFANSRGVRIPTLLMPCLLLVGEADARRAAVERCAKRIPQTFPTLGHVTTFARSDLVLPQVIRFLGRRRGNPDHLPTHG